MALLIFIEVPVLFCIILSASNWIQQDGWLCEHLFSECNICFIAAFISACSKAPSWLRTFAPADALVMQEEAWNSYPRCKSGYILNQIFLAFVTALFSERIFH